MQHGIPPSPPKLRRRSVSSPRPSGGYQTRTPRISRESSNSSWGYSPRTSRSPSQHSEESGWQTVKNRKKTATKKVSRRSISKQKIEPDIFREVKAGKVYSVTTILRRGQFDINCFFAGRTLLHWASNNGNAKMVAWLLEYKADIRLRAKHQQGTFSGFTALDFAAMAPGNPETVARLLMAEVRWSGAFNKLISCYCLIASPCMPFHRIYRVKFERGRQIMFAFALPVAFAGWGSLG